MNFTNKLNLDDAADSAKQPKEIWAEFSVGDSVMGSRSRLPDDAMVQILLASDASIATYLTLAYEGDDNPITTIYRDLPLSSVTSDGSSNSLRDYFTAIPSIGDQVVGNEATRADFWLAGTGGIYYSSNVGIADSAPDRSLSVKYSSVGSTLDTIPTVSVANTHVSTGGVNDFSFSSFEFTGGNRAAVGEFFADGSGFFP